MLTFEQMKELLELVASRNLGGVEVRGPDFKYRVKGRKVVAAPTPATFPAFEAAAAALPAESEEESDPEPEGYILTSSIVGTFYIAPSPDADPYVQAGDRVEKGQVLCIVEAMKLMNEIESDVAGIVLEVLPQNAQPVEFGEPLFSIKTD